MCRFLIASLSILLASVSLAQSEDEAEAVRRLFERYKVALLQGEGELASELVDADTLTYFDEIRKLTLGGDEEAVRQRPFVDRLLIITMRHELPAATLEQMELADLLQHAVEAGWIGKQSIAQLSIGAIEIDGDEATGAAVTTGVHSSSFERPVNPNT